MPLSPVSRLSWRLAIFPATLLRLVCPGQPASNAEPGSVVAISTLWSQNGVRPGGVLHLAVMLDIRKPYHVSADTAKDPDIPLSVRIISAPEDVRGSTPSYPASQLIDFDDSVRKRKIQVFSDRAAIFMTIAVAASARPGDLPIQIRVEYQACNDRICLIPAQVTN